MQKCDLEGTLALKLKYKAELNSFLIKHFFSFLFLA